MVAAEVGADEGRAVVVVAAVVGTGVEEGTKDLKLLSDSKYFKVIQSDSK